ncbi:MAG: hypothetical protein REI78_07100 [Pedobacter sp.]|nr:hypothetical protein [Pedobacter sp.]MDQ8052775.1 hypothetical protein [Pedobacter sp.]
MNNTFNITRFGLLLKRQWLEFGKIYLISLLVALGVIIAFYGIALWDVLALHETFQHSDLTFREPLFLIFGFLFITVIASTYFAHLGQKPKAIIELMIPASTFEKFIAGIFFTGILSTVCYLFLFYITDLVFISKLQSIVKNVSAEETKQLDYLHKYVDVMPSFAYVVPLFFTSIFLLGSIYFNKFHYIKTAVAAMIFTGIWTYIVVKTGELLMEGRIPVEQHKLNWSEQTAFNLITLLLLVLTFIFWAITYVRLKEKEV